MIITPQQPERKSPWHSAWTTVRRHRFTTLFCFLGVGVSGVVVNLLVLTLIDWLTASEVQATAAGILVSIISNYALHRYITFQHVPAQPFLRQLFCFAAASAASAIVSFVTTIGVTLSFPSLALQVAALFGIAAGTVFNYLSSVFFVFQPPKEAPVGSAALSLATSAGGRL